MTETETAAFRPEARSPRGLQDRRAADLRAERRIIEAVSTVYERFGFEAFDTSAFEYADALGKFLPDSDRPNEGVFALQDDDEQWMALRYDLTAPLARFVAQNAATLPKPFRRYAFGSVWRNEKPGPGRYREFIQCDADTVGSARPEADAEMVAMAVEALEAIGLPAGSTVVRINDRKLLNGLLTTAGVDDAAQTLAVLRAVDKLDRLGLDGVERLLGAGRKDESGAFTKGADLAPAAIERVLAFVQTRADTRSGTLERLAEVVGGSPAGEEGLAHLARIDSVLTSLGVGEVQAVFEPSVVRGLEYYTGPVWELELLLETLDERGQGVRFGSIGSGGRYDDLVARFTGERVPATGLSFGVSRLAAALRASGQEPATDRGPVVVIAFSPDDMGEYFKLVGELRAAGIAAEVYLGQAGMKAQMKYADRRRSPAAVIVGSDELAAGTVTIKDLDAGRAAALALKDNSAWRGERPGQVTARRAEMVETVRRILGSTP